MSIKSLQGRLPHFDGAAFSVLAFSVARAVIRPVQAVTEDIFIPQVRPRRSVNKRVLVCFLL